MADLIGRRSVSYQSLFAALSIFTDLNQSSFLSLYFDFKQALWVSDALCLIGWLAISFSKVFLGLPFRHPFFSICKYPTIFIQGAWSLDLGRLLVGIGIGILAYVVGSISVFFHILLIILTLDFSSHHWLKLTFQSVDTHLCCRDYTQEFQGSIYITYCSKLQWLK